jgi:tape measure domain-containing protein
VGSVELATAYIALVPSLKGASAAISKELGGIDTAGAGAEMGRKTGSGLLGGLRGFVAPAAAILGGGMFAGFIADAAKASDATDKFKATMSFAGMDSSAITKAAAAAKSYADQTVYDLPTIQNMTAQLASNGVKDYTGLTQAAGNLNAVAGGNADTFKSVAMVMTQTAGAGKLTTENWNQMADAIPGAAGPLMKAMKDAGAYTGNFRDAMAAGEITSDEFNAALMKLGKDPVAVEAAKSTKTFEGAIGNLQATINSGLMSALDALKPAITGVINLMSKGLGAAFDATGAAVAKLGAAFTLLRTGNFTGGIRKTLGLEEDSAIVGALLNIHGGIKAMFAAYKAGDGDVTSSGFAGVMERVGNLAREVTGGFRAMFAAYKAGDGDVTSSGFAGFMERVGNMAREVTRGFTAMFAAFKAGDGDVTSSGFPGLMERVGFALREGVGGVRAFFAAFKAGDGDVTSSGFAGLMEKLGGQARKLADSVGPVLRSVFAAVGPLLRQLGAAVAPLVPQLIQLWSAASPLQIVFKSLAPVLPQLLSVFGRLAVVVGGTLGAALKQLVPVFVQLQGVFVRVFQQVLATALPVIVRLVTMLGQTFTQLVPIIVPIITTVVSLASTLIAQLAPILMRLIGAVLPMVVTIFGAVAAAIGPLIQVIAGLLIPIIQALMPVVVTVFGVIANVITSAMQIVQGIIMVVTGIITGNWSQVWNGILSILSGVWNTITSRISGAIGIVGSLIGAGLGIVRSVFTSVWSGVVGFLGGIWGSITSGVSGMIGNVIGFFGGLLGKITGAIGNAAGALFGIGQNIIQGLINGISSMMGAIGNAIISLVPGPIVGVFKDLLGIRSPSRVFHAFGGYIGQGLINGLNGSISQIRSTTSKMAKEIIAAFDHHAITRGVENRLLNTINSTNRSLVGLANRRDAILSRLKTASKSYADALKVRNDYAASVRDDALGGVDASQSRNLVKSLTDQITKTKELSSTLASLKKLGLDSTTYKQLADGGVDSLKSAQRLLATGKSGIANVVSLQKQLGAAAKGLGNTAADNLYGAGVNSAKGLVDGLKSQSAAISAQMAKIAGSMVGAIKKALGIRSPSTVFHGFGQNIVQGLMNGVDTLSGDLNTQMGALVTVPKAPAFGRAGAALPVGGRGNVTNNNSYTINQVDDPIGTAHAISRRQRSLTV